MTGYAKILIELPKRNINLEIKSLNSKQLDMNIKMPQIYKEKEFELRTMLANAVERGKIDLLIYTDEKQIAGETKINKELVVFYFNELLQISKSVNNPTNSDLLALAMRMPDVLKTEKNEPDDTEWLQLNQGIQDLLYQFDQYRTNEGKNLALDFKKRIQNIKTLLDRIIPLENNRIERIRSRIWSELNAMKEKERININRFEEEMIYYLEKLDINEEKVRLQNHIDFFEKAMNDSVSNGRKLGFISQEMGREINTIGSKANDADIQSLVVEMKDELEKIKEQLLNVL